jgi:hypothetical protein
MGNKINTNPDLQGLTEEQRLAERRKRRAQQRIRREKALRRQKILALTLAVLFITLFAGEKILMHKAWAQSPLSEKVLAYKGTVKKYAKREKIEQYTDVLLAIMMAETKGEHKDVMQSSESKGLERNSLGPEESIEQACIYFRRLSKSPIIWR